MKWKGKHVHRLSSPADDDIETCDGLSLLLLFGFSFKFGVWRISSHLIIHQIWPCLISEPNKVRQMMKLTLWNTGTQRNLFCYRQSHMPSYLKQNVNILPFFSRCIKISKCCCCRIRFPATISDGFILANKFSAFWLAFLHFRDAHHFSSRNSKLPSWTRGKSLM